MVEFSPISNVPERSVVPKHLVLVLVFFFSSDCAVSGDGATNELEGIGKEEVV